MKGKATIGTLMLMWTFTVFLAMFWAYLPGYYGFMSDLFLILALISASVSFRVTIKRK